MDMRRRKIFGSVDENNVPVPAKSTFGKAMKEVKKVGLSLRPTESKVSTKPPLAPSKSLYKKTTCVSQSFVPVECFDEEQKYLYFIERCRSLKPLFLENKIINGKMRAILFDWMLQVQERFSLEHDTLHLAYLMVDRCLYKMNIKKDKLQLLGATCLFLSTKFEEISIPHINDFIYLAASAFSKKDIMVMERQIFQAVNFNMGFAYPIHFLRRYRYTLQNKDDTHTLSKLFIDLFMSVYETSHKLPSVMAQVSLYLSFLVSGKKLPTEMYRVMGITERELKKECCDFIEHIVTFSTTPKETTLHRKYNRMNIKSRLSDVQIQLLKPLKLH